MTKRTQFRPTPGITDDRTRQHGAPWPARDLPSPAPTRPPTRSDRLPGAPAQNEPSSHHRPSATRPYVKESYHKSRPPGLHRVHVRSCAPGAGPHEAGRRGGTPGSDRGEPRRLRPGCERFRPLSRPPPLRDGPGGGWGIGSPGGGVARGHFEIMAAAILIRRCTPGRRGRWRGPSRRRGAGSRLCRHRRRGRGGRGGRRRRVGGHRRR